METLEMTAKERRRLELLSRVRDNKMTLMKAAELLAIGYRQAKRLYSRYRAEGDSALVHRLRGRPSNRGSAGSKKERVLELYREKYADFGPTLATEYLAREEDQVVGIETLRQWLLSAGLWSRKRRRPAHRRWRQRRAHRGELVQMDGSHHDWFEGRRGWAVLMVMIDDATNETYARFFEEETTWAAFETFRRYALGYGLPQGLYVDRDSIYRVSREATGEEALAGDLPMTQFGRAMKELAVGLNLASSPQAKGRVERRHGVLQDRLVKAMRRQGISDLETANRFLEEEFMAELNERFTVAAREKADLHRVVGRKIDLDRILSIQEKRKVQNDWTIRWDNRWLQLTAANPGLALVGRQVTLSQRRDGTLRVLLGDRELAFQELTERPKRPNRPPKCRKNVTPRRRPAANHPWRQPNAARRSGS